MRPARVDPAGLDRVDDPFRDQREDAEQNECADESRRQDARGRSDRRQLRAGVDVDERASQHAELANPVEAPGADRGQAHRQVDGEERHRRNQPEREEIEPAFPGDPLVDGTQVVAEARLHPVAQNEA